MTTLFRQGVESVCEGKRERQTECKSPSQKEAQVGLGPRRLAERGTGVWGYREKQAQHSVGFSKLAARQPLLCTSTPACPQAYDCTFQACASGLISQREIC